MEKELYYPLFFEFLQENIPNGFQHISSDSSQIHILERQMEKNHQFFFICDLIKINILYTSKGSKSIVGITPEEISPYYFFEATHPEDIRRHSLGRAKLFKMAQDIFINEKGFALLSSNLRLRIADGKYADFLFQCYLFYSALPIKTVYLLQLHTNIDKFTKKLKGFHYYVGEDLSYFRYPDNELIRTGNIFSIREFEIISLIAHGMSTEQIAKKLYLSPTTINTHRRNILKKSGKNSFATLIFDLQEVGLL